MPDLLVDIEWNVMTGVQQMPLGVNLRDDHRSHNQSTGSYQRLDLFLKVLRVLCPNLTDDPGFTLDCSFGIAVPFIFLSNLCFLAVSVMLLEVENGKNVKQRKGKVKKGQPRE